MIRFARNQGINDACPTTTGDFRSRIAHLVELQNRLTEEPYSISLRLELAGSYKELGYPDLAAGDSYKALLLIDELDQEGEYHDEVLEAATANAASVSQQTAPNGNGIDSAQEVVEENKDDEDAVTKAKTIWSSTAYNVLIACLIDCGSLRSAFDFTNRASRSFPGSKIFSKYHGIIRSQLQAFFKTRGYDLESVDVSEYPDRGLVRREEYPWNTFEPDRFSVESIRYLNSEMSAVAPKLEVKVASLPSLSGLSVSDNHSTAINHHIEFVDQLGVFAKSDIKPGEELLKEKSLLTAIARLHETYCDACSIPLSTSVSSAEEHRAIPCDECAEVFFCSEECLDLAQETYHSVLCGIDIEQKVTNSEAADGLYFLLLVRALALAHAQESHPLELKEVRYIWGDYHALNLDTEWKTDARGHIIDAFGSIGQTLPFSFNSSILKPLHMLEKMDINIFEESHRYDTWVFNTLYAKFRGTASARQGLDGRPEIGAVHPLWCLANHSCDPNVSWEWNGSMKFWAREKLVDWKGRDPKQQPGIREGQEIFSHYCDIRLPVKERREWAIGALGGECMCARCRWEEDQEIRTGRTT
ncbi:hypothetical protein B0J11DRAFT_604914 [Dendryphion nanum]|uniref:SET domain-containing protein n=1 Tax=Dendryphion nanum TaxID=256645 RepID=A0A9P9DXP4_9PLEO|nr:hypothetical protein B0J11DRAFT_604914 [Dendryphion nanum]